MDEGEKPTNPNDASPVDGTTDVEALLDQAAALAGEIATETGSDALEDTTSPDEAADPTHSATDSPADVEPESDSDVESERGSSADSEPVSESEAQSESEPKLGTESMSGAAEPEALASKTEPNDAAAPIDSESPQAEGESDEIESTLASLESILEDGAAEKVEDKPADGKSEDGKSEDSESGDGKPGAGGAEDGEGEAEEKHPAVQNTISLDEVEFEGEFGGGSDFEESEDEPGDSEDQSAKKESVSQVGSIKSLPAKVIAFVRVKGMPGVRRLGGRLPNLVARPLILIDRPFQHLSPRTKKFLGIAAIVTVMAGIASLVLPMLTNKNPYLDMPF